MGGSSILWSLFYAVSPHLLSFACILFEYKISGVFVWEVSDLVKFFAYQQMLSVSIIYHLHIIAVPALGKSVILESEYSMQWSDRCG